MSERAFDVAAFLVILVTMAVMAWLSPHNNWRAEVVDTRPVPTVTSVDIGGSFGQP